MRVGIVWLKCSGFGEDLVVLSLSQGEFTFINSFNKFWLELLLIAENIFIVNENLIFISH